jgi:hypothetical protein
VPDPPPALLNRAKILGQFDFDEMPINTNFWVHCSLFSFGTMDHRRDKHTFVVCVAEKRTV